MALREVSYDELPDLGDSSAFSLTIDFDRFENSPSRVFRAAAQFTEAFGLLDDAFATAIDRQIEPALTILRVEEGSLRIWFASILRSVDDEALRDLDWKKLIGAYLVRAKYRALEWLEQDTESRRLSDLEGAILIEAEATDVRLIPAYERPSRPLLIEALRRTQSAKDLLTDSDKVSFAADDGVVEMDPARRLDLAQLLDVSIGSRRVFPLSRSHLVVKKPDYLGHSQWQLKFNERTVRATISDDGWLSRFQSREVGLKPGDAIVCDGDYTIFFDDSGTPITEKVVVSKVHGVEYHPGAQPGFL